MPRLTQDELARKVWQQISDLFLSTQGERDQLASELGLTRTDLITLFHLQPDGAVSQRDLAEHWACDPSWVTTRVDRLEELGFVERQPGRTDRRVKMVSLTSDGEKVREAGMEGFAKPPELLLELSAGELRVIAGTLSASADPLFRRGPSPTDRDLISRPPRIQRIWVDRPDYVR